MAKQLWRVTIDTNPEDCNLRCTMCEEHSPYSDFIEKLYAKTGVRKRRMPIEQVEDIFIQCRALGVEEIIPSTMGEPLIYKGMERILELAAKYSIAVNLTTNGTFPRKSVEEWAELIVPVTSDIKFSWNGATKETAESIMLGLNFEIAIENLKRFVAIRNAHAAKGGNYCSVTLQLTFMESNMHELSEIIKLAAAHDVDRVKGHQLWDHFDRIREESFRRNSDSVARWNRYVQQACATQETHRRSSGEKVRLENIIPLTYGEQSEVPEHYDCPFLNRELWVAADGKISPCCAPDEQRQTLGDFGNIASTRLADVLQSNAYQDLVRDYKSHDLCKGCTMRKPLTP